jgi:hypothetical protein
MTAAAATTTINDGRIVNNISRTIFNFIHGNPGINRQNARERLVAQGFKDTSVTSLISQMIRTGMVRLTDDESEALFTTRQEYAPIKRLKDKPKSKKIVVLRKPRTEPVVAPMDGPQLVSPEPILLKGVVPLPTLPSAEYIIKNISVHEAFTLYQQLNKMFGGK